VDKIPLIDASLLNSTNKDVRNKTVKDLYDAFSSIGFVSLTATEINSDIVNNMRSTVKKIFDVDDLTKKKEMITRNNDRGYIPLDFFTPNGTDYKADHYEGYKLHTEVSADDPICDKCSLHGPNIWPSKVPESKTNILKYWSEMDKLASLLLRALEESLGFKKNELIDQFSYPSLTNMTLLHYPVQKINDEAYGFHPHKDTDALTIIAADSTNALEVQTLDGKWISPQESENTFVANIGDMLELWSGGRLMSTPHRVINKSRTDRYSFPYFAVPKYDVTIKPLIEPLEGFSRPTVNCGHWSSEIWRTNWSDEKANDKSLHLGTLLD
jgi:isopenicillin N synthase-like dioxygenase